MILVVKQNSLSPIVRIRISLIRGLFGDKVARDYQSKVETPGRTRLTGVYSLCFALIAVAGSSLAIYFSLSSLIFH